MASSYAMFPSNRFNSIFGGRAETQSGSTSVHRGIAGDGWSSFPTRATAPRRVSQPDGRYTGDYSLGNGLSASVGKHMKQRHQGPQEIEEPINNMEMSQMSQLTMSQALLVENDSTSVDLLSYRSNRSNPSCGVTATNAGFPPLHQSSASSSNGSSNCGSNQASIGSTGLEGPDGSTIMPRATPHSLRGVITGSYHPSAMFTPQKNRGTGGISHLHWGNNMAAPPSHHRNANLMTQMEPTQALLRMTPRHTGNIASGGSLMRFRQGSSCKQSLFPMSHPYSSTPILQQPSKAIGGEARCNQSLSSNRVAERAVDVATDHDQRWMDVQAALDKQFSERMRQLRKELEESVNARFARMDTEQDARASDRIKAMIVTEINAGDAVQATSRMKELHAKESEVDAKLARASQLAEDAAGRDSHISGMLKRVEEKEAEVHTRLAHALEENKIAMAQATLSSIERLQREARNHLDSLCQATDTALFNIGQATEKAACSIVDKGSHLVQTTMPLLQDSVKTLVKALFVSHTGSKKGSAVGKNDKNGHPPFGANGVLHITDEVDMSQALCTEPDAKRGRLLVAVDSGSQDRRNVVVSVKGPDVDEQGETQPVSSRLRHRMKRQRHNDARKEKTTPQSQRSRSCVTPTVQTSQMLQSSTLPVTKRSSDKSTIRRTRGVPLEVLVTTDHSASPASGLEEKVFVSPPSNPARKRGRSMQRKGGTAKRTQTYSKKSARSFQEDTFEFL
jgi:hypothetical protein